MKPLRLELTAFGPFGGTEVVDFDKLSELGLYLVAGPTGAGKSSVFDALAYALYGAMPGARESVRQPRSDHAESRTDTRLVLDFEAQGSRWRVERWPMRVRSKKRGAGTTVDQAKARLERDVDGVWVPESARMHEVNQRCIELVGLNAAQFERVVLLPQGRFERFLHASTLERRDLLRTLFGSDLFARAERVLADRAGAATTELAVAVQRRDDVAGRLDGARSRLVDAASALGLTIDEATVDVEQVRAGAAARARAAVVSTEVKRDERDLAARVVELIRCRDALAERRRELDIAQAGAHLAARQAADGRRSLPVVDAIDQLRVAQDQAAAALVLRDERFGVLATATASVGVDVASCDEADLRRAARCLEQLGLDLDRRVVLQHDVDSLSRGLAESSARARELESGLAQLESERSAADDSLQGARALAERVPALDVLADRAREQADRRAVYAATGEQLARMSAEIADLDTAAARSVERLDRYETELAQAAAEVASLESAPVELTEFESAVENRRRLVQLDAEIESALQVVDDRRRAFDRSLDDFVTATAPRLAARLTPGDPCPVCGSLEHPHPAVTSEQPTLGETAIVSPDAAGADLVAASNRLTELATARSSVIDQLGEWAVSDDETVAARLRGARLRLDRLSDGRVRVERLTKARQLEADAEAERQVAGADLRTRHAVEVLRLGDLAGQLGPDVGRPIAEIIDAAEYAHDEWARAASAAGEIANLAGVVDDLAGRHERTLVELDSIQASMADIDLKLSDRRHELASLHLPVPDLDAAADPARLLATRAAVASAVGALQPVFVSTAEVQRAVDLTLVRAGDLASTLAVCGFATADDAVSAWRPVDQLAGLDREWETWQAELTRIEADERALDGHVLPVDVPDLASLTVELAHAEDRVAERMSEAGRIDGLVDAVQLLQAEATDTSSVADRRHAEVAAIGEVAAVCRGENPRRVTLESWVLRSRLEEVVDRANVHLARLSRGRYQMAVADGPIDRRHSAGLDLVVDDAATGRQRPTNTLSGGETFQASLVLALGLADVVMEGRAGLALETLFIDEGFGTLDADSLELAVDLLHDLRSVGQTIGVVTHVDALKAALPVGLDVRRRSDGRGSELATVA